MPRRRNYRTPLVSVGTRKAQTRQISFKGGVNTYKDNDDLDVTELAAAIDGRMVKIGRYKTRKGLDRFSVPVGETKDAAYETTYTSTFAIPGTNQYAQKLTVVSSGRVTKVEVQVATSRSTTVPENVVVELRSDNSGAPGPVVATSGIDSAVLTSTPTWTPVYFIDAPAVTASGIIWLTMRLQSSIVSGASVSVACKADANNFYESLDGGTTWHATSSGAFRCRLYVSTSGGTLGMERVNRPNGLNYAFFVSGTTLYSVDEGTGALTTVKTGLSASATKYRFAFVQDALYWVNGYEKPYKYDFSTVTQLTACPINPDLIIEHAGLLFVAREDDTKVSWSNFGVYDTWTSTDFAYMGAPKSPFTLRALAKLNGVLYTLAQRNKYQLMGSTNSNFTQYEASSQRGTFSQESLVYDDNTIYYANDDGIWAFNGTDDTNLAADFLGNYKAIPNKSSIVLEKWNGRLYVFFASAGSPQNDKCYVINLDLGGKLESLDTGTPISHTSAVHDRSNKFLQASNTVGAIYQGEAESNNYSNLGAPLQFEIRTGYSHFDAPGQRKRITNWRPEFVSGNAHTTVECSYAFDFATAGTTTSISLNSSGAKWGAFTWGDGTKYASDENIQGMALAVNGIFRRIQRRYKHVAAFDPVEIDSEVLSIEVQRLI